jgi:ATP phosphoribosyltransferase regulatory subunit
MGNWKKYIPDGTRDIIFQDCANKLDIENALRRLFLSRGFADIITPTLEFYDVFDEDETWIEQEKMYKLFDNQGRILVLRPDITIPIARVAGTKLKESYYPLRLCYCSNVFRTNESWNGKKNEFTQSGVEIIGIDNFRADVEVIVTAIQALLECGFRDFKVELGQVQFYKGIIEDLEIEPEDIEKIRSYIENKNFGTLKDFLESKGELIDKGAAEALSSLPRLFGGIRVLEDARKLTSNVKALKALDNIENIYNILGNMELSDYISVDLGMVHHIDYYTGLIFRGYIEGAGEDVLFGGRYDNLISRFGQDIPATGFAIDVDSILKVLSDKGFYERSLNADYLIHYSEEFVGKANLISAELRKAGYICELSLFESSEETKAYAVRKKIRKILLLENKDRVLLQDIEADRLEEYRGLEVKDEESETGSY